MSDEHGLISSDDENAPLGLRSSQSAPKGGKKLSNSPQRVKKRKSLPCDGKETLWDIVCRNVRPVSKDKPDANAGKEIVEASRPLDPLESLFGGMPGTSPDEGTNALEDLLGGCPSSRQPLGSASSTSKPVLSLDGEGNFLMEDPTADGSGNWRDFDLSELTEGKSSELVTLGYDSQIQPYAGAYKKTKCVRWTTEETNRLYEAMEVFGSDLMLVRTMLPHFTDKQILDKFKVENKRSPAKVTAALEKQTDASNAKRMLDVLEATRGRDARKNGTDEDGEGLDLGGGNFGDDLLACLADSVDTPDLGGDIRDDILSMFN